VADGGVTECLGGGRLEVKVAPEGGWGRYKTRLRGSTPGHMRIREGGHCGPDGPSRVVLTAR